jgi:hypothetical protein
MSIKPADRRSEACRLDLCRQVIHSLVKLLNRQSNAFFELDTTMHAPVMLMVLIADELCEFEVAEVHSAERV